MTRQQQAVQDYDDLTHDIIWVLQHDSHLPWLEYKAKLDALDKARKDAIRRMVKWADVVCS